MTREEFAQAIRDVLREEQAHERALPHRYAEVKKLLGLSGAGRR